MQPAPAPNPKTQLWNPSHEKLNNSNSAYFRKWVNKKRNLKLTDFEQLYSWSVEENLKFWSDWWDYSGIIGDKGEVICQNPENLEESRWFPQAKLNYTENLFHKWQPADLMLESESESHLKRKIYFAEVRDKVAALAAFMKNQGIDKNSLVCGVVTNSPEAMIAYLASASLGACWAAVSPEFGYEAIMARIEALSPSLLIGCSAYQNKGKVYTILDKLQEIQSNLPSIQEILVYDNYQLGHRFRSLEAILTERDHELEFTRLSFNHPLCILFSSGTTGKPKAIIHGVGGTLLQHTKEHFLHGDMGLKDTLFYYTTPSWMMWNWSISALFYRVRLLVYDGSAFFPSKDYLLALVLKRGVSHFGTSSSYLMHLKKNTSEDWQNKYQFKKLRVIYSTGSVLDEGVHAWVTHNWNYKVVLASISGGSDIISCFILSSLEKPVYAGYAQAKGLGMDVTVLDSDGVEVWDKPGELVCCNSFPSKPLGFFGDTDNKLFHKAYFSGFTNIWKHGDVAIQQPGNFVRITGRSDAIMNISGVRIGTSEIYAVLAQFGSVLEAVAIERRTPQDSEMLLLLVLGNVETSFERLQKEISASLFKQASPRHVPKLILRVGELPKTGSGKLMETLVKNIFNQELEIYNKNKSSVINPQCLEELENLASQLHNP